MARARICPKCGGKLFVIGTYRYKEPTVFDLKNQYTHRRLKCVDCGFRFGTYEIFDDDFKKWVSQHRSAENKVKQTERVLKTAQRDLREWLDRHQ